jgi:hypothetical protein
MEAEIPQVSGGNLRYWSGQPGPAAERREAPNIFIFDIFIFPSG